MLVQQVYHPRGNESSLVNTDPYVNSSCSMCNCSRDEELLLLCELCDAAAHTYCVGLGTTVPEGDWFCKDCATSKEEHSRCEIDDAGSSDQGEFEITTEVPSAEPVADPTIFYTVDEAYSLSSVRRANASSSGHFLVDSVPSIYDIVDEDYATNRVCRSNVRSTRLDRKADDFRPSTSSDESYCHETPQERTSGRTFHSLARFRVEKARTLPNSRNLSNRIMALRENWPALRAGSVGFATHLHNNRRENGTGTISAVSDNKRCATSMVATSSVNEHQHSIGETTTMSEHANKISPKETSHVRKAWKMLEMAKSAGERKKCNKPSSPDCTPRFSMGNRSSSCCPIDTILGQMNQTLSNEVAQRNTVKYGRGSKKDNTLPKKDNEGNCKLPVSYHVLAHERMGSSRDRMVNLEGPNDRVASSSHSEHVDQMSEASCGVKVASSSHSQHIDQTLLHPLANNSLSSARSTVTSALQFASNAGSQSSTMVKPEGTSAVCDATTSNEIGIAGATVQARKGSGPDCHGSKRKHCFETCDGQGSKKSRTSCKIAKAEISSMAMRELKLLKIDKTHGSDRFKEVARAATHTVLASCGLEHSPSLALALPKPACKDSCRTEPLKLSAITNTCRECLCDFVKQVISSVLSGRQMDQTGDPC